MFASFVRTETEVKNEVQDCPENESVPGSELYIDENAEEKEQEYPDSMEKAEYGTLYGANQYYNRYAIDYRRWNGMLPDSSIISWSS